MSKIGTTTSIRFGAIWSRRLLLESVKALAEFNEAITVVGAHAVHVWVQDFWGSVDMEATRDADVCINPSFVTSDPKIIEELAKIGVVPALKSRPGVYGLSTETGLPLEARTTFDILVPETYAGSGRRAARIVGQKNAAGRALGLELTPWDRKPISLATIDNPVETLKVNVAGPAALLVAKTYKVHERLEQAAVRPDRLRPKDSGDIALLMMVSKSEDVARVMMAGIAEHPEIGDVVMNAAAWLVEMYGHSSTTPVIRQQAADSLANRFSEAEVLGNMDLWVESFKDALENAIGIQDGLR